MGSLGTVVQYDAKRGFGFIKDDTDGLDVFSHMTRVEGRISPQVGTWARYVREIGGKGFQAGKVWLPEGIVAGAKTIPMSYHASSQSGKPLCKSKPR